MFPPNLAPTQENDTDATNTVWSEIVTQVLSTRVLQSKGEWPHFKTSNEGCIGKGVTTTDLRKKQSKEFMAVLLSLTIYKCEV
jgi:hypothetical protein